MSNERATQRPSSKSQAEPIAELLRSATGLLALQALPGIGPAKALRAALFTTNFDGLVEARADAWEQALDDAANELHECERQGVTALGIFDEAYPSRLRALHDPPPVIFVHGSVEVLSEPRIAAVVGTREPTRFGCSAAEAITASLAGAGWAVISGLAKGIDTIAHGAALKHDTPTVAVLAGGLDYVYPAENKELAAAIVDQGGALIAERRWGQRPHRSSFVERNRLQTGLAAAVVVAQTGVVGGTMHTARHAAAQRRALFCPQPRSRHEKNDGLEVLLSTPARELCAVLPAWKDSCPLCARLGDEPLARPVRKDRLEAFIDAIEGGLESDPQTVVEPRWWPQMDPPALLEDHDAVTEDDDESTLFSFAD